MSVRIMSQVWETRLPDPTMKLVMLKLADHANDDGVCWPSIRTIMRHTDLSRSTVFRRLKELEASGMIARTQNEKDGKNFYKLFPSGGCPTDTPFIRPGVPQTPGGCQRDTPPIYRTTKEPSSFSPPASPTGGELFPVEVSPAKPARAKAKPDKPAPDPRHHEIITGWAKLHAGKHPPYHFNGRDMARLSAFLKTSKLSAAEFLAVAQAAWKHRETNKFAVACKRSGTLHELCDSFNSVAAELRSNENNRTNYSRAEGTANARADMSQYDEP